MTVVEHCVALNRPLYPHTEMPTQPMVMVVEDDHEMRWLLRNLLGATGFSVAEASTGEQAFELVRQRKPDTVLLDIRLPGLGGEALLRRLRQFDMSLPVIMVTAFGSIPGAVDAVRCGAFDYLTKPFSNDELLDTVSRAVRQRRGGGMGESSRLRHAVTEAMGPGPAIQQLVDQMEAVAGTDFSVLVLGETGTGKEIVARALHDHGPRAGHPLVQVDCGALVESLTGAELFGHEKGAYTGAHERRRGQFEMAGDGGTLFLDEIGNLPPAGQQALLRVLEQHVIYRVGSSVPLPIDARVIAATNENIFDGRDGRRFRPDLYFRIAEFVIELPPLRNRKEDLEFLVHRFLRQVAAELGSSGIEVTPAALDLLHCHDWPGNVRELRNVVRRAALIAGGVIDAPHIIRCLKRHCCCGSPPPEPAGMTLRHHVAGKVREIERQALLDALAEARGNKAQAARLLGIDAKTFRTKLKYFNGLVTEGNNGHP